MRKLISIAALFTLFNCSYFDKSKINEEVQYYNFNEKSKSIVKKDDIYITKVTKTDILNSELSQINKKYGSAAMLVGSWDFSSKPTNELKNEISNKAIELGANYIIILEKKNCGSIDITKDQIDLLPDYYCYRIYYYNLPLEDKKKTKDKPPLTPATTPTDKTPTENLK